MHYLLRNARDLDFASNLIHGRPNVSQDILLPQSNYGPICRFEDSRLYFVSLTIVSDLWNPIVWVRPARQLTPKLLPISSVPEISIDEDTKSCCRENNIGLAREIFHLLAISKTAFPEFTTKQSFCFTTISLVRALYAR